MLSLLKNIPLLVAIWRGAENLKGMTKSHTTKVQGIVLSILALAVSALGFFLPEFASADVQQAVFLCLVAVVGTIISRMAGYRAKTAIEDQVLEVPPVPTRGPRPATATIWLCRVNTLLEGDSSWKPFIGTVLEAKMQGYLLGVDELGNVWDITDGTKTGDTVRLNEPESDEEIAQNQAAFDKWYAAVREKIAKKKVIGQ